MSIDHLKSLVSDELSSVNSLIIDKVSANSGLIDELCTHIIQSGGKRLRPLIVLLASLASGYKGDKHIKLAAMIEFFHTATLLHDDVVDESKMRRGRETANNIWGSKASILVGDFLFSLYIELIVDVGNMQIMRLLSGITNEVTRGEIKQLNNKHNSNLSFNEYFNIIRSKTSLLFAASAAIGSIISDAPKDMEESLFQYGMHLGNAFQIVDDMLDYCSDSDTIGKNIGDDLADGKATLPLIYILENGSESQKNIIRTSLRSGDKSSMPQVIEILTATNAFDYCREVAIKESYQAIECLQILPESKYKQSLIDIAKYAVSRSH